MSDLESVKQYFSNDRYATECTGIEIEAVSQGYAKCTLKIQPRHCNALGKPMGGAIFTLADFAFAVASNFGDDTVVSQVSQITYLSAAKGSTLIAQAREVKSGRKTCFYQIEVNDELGTKVAYITASGIVTGG